MAVQILMPALSPTMEEGRLSKWLVAAGDSVRAGQVIAEIETDKATMEYEAADDGIMGRILVPEGTGGVKVNTPIAILVEEGEAVPDAAAPAPAAAAAPPEGAQAPAPAAPQKTQAPAPAPAVRVAAAGGGRILASPLARRLAAERGIDLAGLAGSGPHGRIVRSDVEAAGTRAASVSVSASAPATGAPPVPPSGADAASVMALYAGRAFTEVPLDGMRRVIAQRLGEAKRTIPHFYLHRDVRIDALLALRAALNHALKGRDIRLSVNDFIIRACALALQAVPDANAVWAGDRILKLGPSDVAVAVAVEGGLFTPVLRDAETKTLSALSAEMRDLATRAKSKRLAPHEYQGGSFAISNLGMFGIDSFEAVINPPHGAILAVGAGVKRAVVQEDGSLGVATVMSLSLSADHRVIDGALGAMLLKAIVEALENPHSILV